MEKKKNPQNDTGADPLQIVPEIQTQVREPTSSEPVLIRELLLPIQEMTENPDRNELLAQYFS